MGPAEGYSWTGRGLALGPKFKCILGKEGHTDRVGLGEAGSEDMDICGTPGAGVCTAYAHTCSLCTVSMCVHAMYMSSGKC